MTLPGHEPEEPTLLDEIGIFIVRILQRLGLWWKDDDMGDFRK